MKNFLFFVCLLCAQPFFLHAQSACEDSEAYAELNINNVRAGLKQNGSLWWNGSDGKYFAPNDTSGVSAIFAGGIWAAGIMPDSTVRSAAVRYANNSYSRYDYFPGPLNPLTGDTYMNGCHDWDKHFIIYHYEKNSHQTDFENDGIIDNPIPAIFGWPARNNPYFSQYNGFDLPENTDLAPFIDLNGDNVYDPAAGDYPDTKGDQTIWWIFNDKASEHMESNEEPIGLEIQAMAYAFQSFEEEVNNTTFYDFKLTYIGEESLSDFNFGLWTDVDLGCWTDDNIGFNEERDMAFYYNYDEVDGEVGDQCGSVETYGNEIPMLGIKLMSDSDDLGVTSFTYYIRTDLLGCTEHNSPLTPRQYLNYMKSMWRNGLPVLYGNNGIVGEGTATYVFPGNPSDETEWSMCSTSATINSDLELNTIMSTGGNTLNPGDVKEYSYAVIFTPDVPHPCPSLDILGAAADVIENFDCTVSSVLQLNFAEEIGLKLSPNPASQQFTVSVDAENVLLNNAEIIDLGGNVLQQKHKVNARNLAFDIENLATGMYFVKVTTDEGKVAVRKLVVQ